MKKVLKAGKKPLSLFLAVVMLITTWVFVAPTKAGAVTAGNYNLTININVTNKADKTSNIQNSYFTIRYKGKNGTEAQTEMNYDLKNSGYLNSEGNKSFTISVPGFPTSMYVYHDATWDDMVHYTLGTITVSGTKSQNAYTGSKDFHSGGWGNSEVTGTINFSAPYPKADSVVIDQGIDNLTVPSTGTTNSSKELRTHLLDQYGVRVSSDKYSSTPTVTFDYSNNNGVKATAGSTQTGYDRWTVGVNNNAKIAGDTSSKTVKATISYSFNGSNASNSTSFTLTDVSYTFTFDGNGGNTTQPKVGTQTLDYDHKLGYDPLAERAGFEFKGFYETKFDDSYETPKYSGTKASATTRMPNANKNWYAAWQAERNTVTFNYPDDKNVMQTKTFTDYYGYDVVEVPGHLDSFVIGDYTYTFDGWYVGETKIDEANIPSTIPADDITYTAKYTSEFTLASYAKVEEQITRAEAKAGEQDFDDKYTAETLDAFNKALDNAKKLNRGLGASQQDYVDSFATALSNAIDALQIKKFVVLFVDEEGAIVKDGYHYVEYGASVTVPDSVEKDYDKDFHYVFAGWDNSGNSDDISACEKVTDDLMFIAKFNRYTHSYTHEGGTQTIPSDCTTNGVIKYTCTCGYSYTEANPEDEAHHRFPTTYTTLKAATCSAEGIEAIVCDDCGAVKPDSIRSIDKLGHTFGDWTTLTPATCYNHGAEKRTCSVCQAIEVRDIEQLNHNWEIVEGADADGWVTTEATCTAPGYKTRKCTNPNCNYVQTVQTEPAKGHNEKSPWTTRNSATCVSDGYEVQICSDCGVIINTRKIDASGHKWSEDGSDGWTVRYEATCVGYGIEERTCLTCGKTEYREIAMKDHTEVIDEAVPATCTSGGLTAGTHCSFCGRVITPQEPIGALGHNYDSAWTTKSEATCQSNGYEVQICDRDGCGEILNTRVKDAIPHVWDTSVEGADADGWVTTTAATCTEDGEAERTCIATTGHHHTETKVLPKLGHDWGEWTQSKAPTCTEPGEEQRVCGNDNTHVETRKVPATGHNYTTDVKQPTCTDAGYTKHTCACGDEYFTDIVNPNGHHFVEDKTAYVEPTNTQPGQKVFYCDNKDCTVRYTVELAPQGHTFAKDEANSQAPKCTEPGWNIFKCTAHENCGITYREELPELGHHFVLDHEKTIPASCLTDGTNAYKCDRDGCTATMTETVKAVGHDMQFVEHIDADCIHYGRDIYKCSKCNYTEERQIDTEKPTGTHDFGVLLVVAPTCTQQGFTVFKCRVCDATFRGDFKAPLGHEWDEGHHIDPTCTEPGGTLYTCTRTETYVDENGKTQTKQCGATKLEDEEPALGHDMGQWYFAPDGDHYVNKRDCNREGCPYSEYEEINGEKVVYYKVDFVSYKYVGEYYTAGDGTKLAYSMDEQPNAYKEVVVDTQYIKSGEPCKYAGEKLELPKTKAFGVYNLTGWKLDKGDLSNVTANITAKAQFQGEEIYYEVNFYSYDGHLVKGPVHVLHGHPVAKDDRPFDEYVTRPNNNQYKYEFTGKWDKDIEAIYSTGPIHAVFKQIPLTYKVVFHDWDGKVITSQILGYGEGVNESNKIIFDNMKPRKEDDAYIYEWTPASRRWVDAKGNIVDENHVKVPDNQGYQEYTPEKEKDEFLSDREKGIFHVYASYPQKVKYYRFNVSAKYADGSIAEGATVTVQSPDGQLVYTTKLNEKGTATVTVEHYEYVTVNITGGGETNSLKIGLGKDNIVDGYFGNEGDEIPSFAFELSNYVDPDPDHGGSTKCKCICHTFLGGLWINFLNILYRLFGKKTVCCHDMYEKHGDRLAYGK